MHRNSTGNFILHCSDLNGRRSPLLEKVPTKYGSDVATAYGRPAQLPELEIDSKVRFGFHFLIFADPNRS